MPSTTAAVAPAAACGVFVLASDASGRRAYGLGAREPRGEDLEVPERADLATRTSARAGGGVATMDINGHFDPPLGKNEAPFSRG